MTIEMKNSKNRIWIVIAAAVAVIGIFFYST